MVPAWDSNSNALPARPPGQRVNLPKTWLNKISGKTFPPLFPLPAAREWENFFILALS